MTTAAADSRGSAAVSHSSTSLCWYGTLPAIGEVKVRVPQTDYNEDVDGYFKWGTKNSKDAWNGKQTQIWLGKCPDYQSLPVAGLIFNAFTERVVRQGDSPDYAKVPWPGGIIRLTGEQYERTILGAFRHIFRVDSETGRGKLLYLDIGKHPEVDPNDPNTRPLVTEFTTFNPRTDRYVAEFVYLVKVFDPATAGKEEPESKNYHTLIPTPTMDHFFDSPPPSIADLFTPDGKPRKKG